MLLAGPLAGGCARGESKPVSDSAAARSAAAGAVERSREPLPAGFVMPPVAAPGARPYEPHPVTGGGSIAGTVELAGDPPADSTVHVAVDERACGATLVDRTVERRGSRLGGGVVWLADVRSGKPFPFARRFELGLSRCLLAPRAQPAVVGGTLNVKSGDPVRTRLRFVRRPSGAVVSVVRMNDAGQVVPDERVLDSAGLVEVRGELHPWLRAWLLVFDHPYYAATAADGAFTLADVPPGSYRLVAWHERLGLAEQRVTVEAGKPTTVTLRLGSAAAGNASAADSAAPRDTARRGR